MGTEEFVIFRCKNKHFSVQRFLAVNYFHPLWPPEYYQCPPIIQCIQQKSNNWQLFPASLTDLEKIPDFLGTQLRSQIFSWKTRDFGPFEYRDKERKILPKLTTYNIHTETQFPGLKSSAWRRKCVLTMVNLAHASCLC